MNLGLAKAVDRLLGGLAGRVLSAADTLVETFRPPEPVTRVEHVLVVKFWGLGNWALLRPLVRELRVRWPRATLTIATLAANRPLVEDLADRLLLVRPRGFGVVARDLLGAIAWLRRHRPDVSIDFEQFARAGGLLSRLGGSRQRLGFASAHRGRNGLYTVLVPFHRDRHVGRSFRDLVEAAGVTHADYVPGDLRATAEGRREVRGLAEGGPYVVLHPGSGDNFPGRRWPEAGFVAVGRTAVARGHRVIVTGGAGEAELAGRITEAIGGGAASAAGTVSIQGLVALLADADAVVSNDTGPVHIASALGTPVLAVFGPNTPVLYGPLSAGSRAFYRDLPCSPCLTISNYRSSRCRIHTCTASVPTGEVAGALTRLLEEGTAARCPDPTPGARLHGRSGVE